MKSLLFLDDMQVRHGVMREICDREGVDMYSVYTADAAIHALETGKVEFDAVCLDHDLADEHYAGMYSTGGHTGRVVARWLSTSDREPLVWVHSWNPDGAVTMAEMLAKNGKRVVRMPFGRQSAEGFVKSLVVDNG